MEKKYSTSDLKETFGSKIIRWISFNISNTYILKSKDNRKIFLDCDLGIMFDKDSLETVEVQER